MNRAAETMRTAGAQVRPRERPNYAQMLPA